MSTLSHNRHIKKAKEVLSQGGGHLLHQTTAEEKVILLASILGIITVFFPWFSIKDQVFSGLDNVIYSAGYIIILTGILGVWSVFWAILGKPLPRILSSFALIHGVLGVQMIQLGIISFTIIQSLDRIFLPTDEIPTGPMIIMFCGVAILGAALFENADNQKLSRKTVITHIPQEPSSAEEVLLKKQES